MAASTEVRAQEVDGPLPSQSRALRVVDLRAGVVEERVVGFRVDVDAHVTVPGVAQGPHERSRGLWARRLVLARVMAENRPGQLRVVGLRSLPGHHPVEGDDCTYFVGTLRRQHEGKTSTHAEPDD